MTTAEVATMIAGINLPYAYYQFDKPTRPPFICFYYPGDHDFIADNVNYQAINRLVIELYSENVDFTSEAAIESALKSAGLPYTRVQAYIDRERIYQTTYDTEVLITNA